MAGWPGNGGGNGGVEARGPTWFGYRIGAAFVVYAKASDGLVSPYQGLATSLIAAAVAVVLE